MYLEIGLRTNSSVLYYVTKIEICGVTWNNLRNALLSNRSTQAIQTIFGLVKMYLFCIVYVSPIITLTLISEWFNKRNVFKKF